jgi:DNA polymerase III alpha subunit (gram-positive type)
MDPKKFISVFDTALLLVVGLIGMAGLMGFQNPPADPCSHGKLKQNEQLENELKSKEKEVVELEKQLANMNVIEPNTAQSSESLNAALASAEQIKQECQKSQTIQKDVNDKLNSVEDIVQKSYKQQQLLTMLRTKAGELDSKVKELEIKKTELEKSVSQADIQRSEAKKLQEQIRKQQEENNRLQMDVDKIEKESKRHQLLWWGKFTGQYVLLECKEKCAVAYLPDGSNRQISPDSTGADIDWLKEKVKQIGGALLVVRTGSFEESFYKLSSPLEKLVIEEGKKGKKIEYGFWPVEDNVSISNYISKGN